MKKNTWLLILLVAVIFISGAAAGFFAERLTSVKHSRKPNRLPHSHKNMKKMFQKRICKRLKPTDEQKKSTKVIIVNWLDEMTKLRQEHAPQYLAVFNKFYDKIAPILTPDQIVELNKWQNRFNRHETASEKNPDANSNLPPKGDNNAAK